MTDGDPAFLRRLYDAQLPFLGRVRRNPRFDPWVAVGRAEMDLDWWRLVLTAHRGGSRRWVTQFRYIVQEAPGGADDAGGWDFPDVFTDASGRGGAACWAGRWLARAWPDWASLDSPGSSTTFIELLAVWMAVTTWAPCWSGRSVRIHVDNLGAVSAWRHRSSRAPRVMAVIRAIVLCLEQREVQRVHLVWLSSESNVVADGLSRMQDFDAPPRQFLVNHGLGRRYAVSEESLAASQR